LSEDKLPSEYHRLGGVQRRCVASCEYALIKESAVAGYVSFGESATAQDFESLRQWMYENVYFKLDKQEARQRHADNMFKVVDFFTRFDFFETDPVMLLTLMTDEEVLTIAELSDNFKIKDLACVLSMGFAEIAQSLPKGRQFDFKDPGLEWGYDRKKA
jgi:hypothetical protein